MTIHETSLIDIAVTPRFEIFYALQALQSEAADPLTTWRRDMQRRLTPKMRSTIARVAPSPLMWPLLADALRPVQPCPSFTEMVAELGEMSAENFQLNILGGVFKGPSRVDDLVSGKASLCETVLAEAAQQKQLLNLLGLLPFGSRQASVVAFTRLVNDSAGFRDDMVSALLSFWSSGFAETWTALEPQIRERARALKQVATRGGPEKFSTSAGLPVTITPTEVNSIRGSTRVSRTHVAGIHIIPSAFNTAKLWAAYADKNGTTRFFIPLLDTSLAPETRLSINPALVFSALGDTTRYAIATTIARKPMTSVDLARAFGVSKPTISHHVQLLRAAGLLEETHTENGTLLALNRRTLERASGMAAREMFSTENRGQEVRRTRAPNKL